MFKLFRYCTRKGWRRDDCRTVGGGLGAAGTLEESVPVLGTAVAGHGVAVAIKRLRRWLCRKHKVKSEEVVRFPDGRPWRVYGLERLSVRKRSFL